MNLEQRSRWLYRIIISLLTVGIIYQGLFLFQAFHHVTQESKVEFPYTSFAYISINLTIPINNENQSGEPIEMSSRGSGMIVGTTADGNAAVLTANHVCNPAPFMVAIWTTGAEKKISVTDFYGNSYDARVILADVKDDLCLLEVEGFSGPGIPLAKEESSIGDKVYSVAAPMAFFSPGMVPLLDGYYSGDIFSSNGIDSIYTVPAREGSSGSSILNEDREIIGVVHSSLTGFQSVTICSTHVQVKAFLLQFEYLLGGTLSQ